MHPDRFEAIIAKYAGLRIAVVGDFCLDRYLEIDSAKKEISIETNLPVHNVVNVRNQPGAAGTILNNLVALGVGEIFPVGFAGEDGEGYELLSALKKKTAVRLDHFLQTAQRRTFTYCKPLLVQEGKPPVELNRLDTKNWTPTPGLVQDELIRSVRRLSTQVEAIILMDQVDIRETGVVTARLLEAIGSMAKTRPELLILADSRRGLGGYPPVTFKMNRAELGALTGTGSNPGLAQVQRTAAELAGRQGCNVFVTLAEQGILGAGPSGEIQHVLALPLRGEIDIVGAGDAVTANLTSAVTAGANLSEALKIANAAASVVIHQLGTTGTASVEQIREILEEAS